MRQRQDPVWMSKFLILILVQTTDFTLNSDIINPERRTNMNATKELINAIMKNKTNSPYPITKIFVSWDFFRELLKERLEIEYGPFRIASSPIDLPTERTFMGIPIHISQDVKENYAFKHDLNSARIKWD